MNGNEKKCGVAILTSDSIDFKTKTSTGDEEQYYIMIKGLIKQENTAIVISMHPTLEYLNI